MEFKLEDLGTWVKIDFNYKTTYGTSCSFTGNRTPNPLKRQGEFQEGKIFNGIDDAGAILGGFETYRFRQGASGYADKSCHSSCMQGGNWCLNSNDASSCFPSGIYVLQDFSSWELFTITIALSRTLPTAVSVCSDILTSTSITLLGSSPTCSYDAGTMKISVVANVQNTLVIGSLICIDDTKTSPAITITASNRNCYVAQTQYPVHNTQYLFRGTNRIQNKIYGQTTDTDIEYCKYIYIYI